MYPCQNTTASGRRFSAPLALGDNGLLYIAEPAARTERDAISPLPEMIRGAQDLAVFDAPCAGDLQEREAGVAAKLHQSHHPGCSSFLRSSGSHLRQHRLANATLTVSTLTALHSGHSRVRAFSASNPGYLIGARIEMPRS